MNVKFEKILKLAKILNFDETILNKKNLNFFKSLGVVPLHLYSENLNPKILS